MSFLSIAVIANADPNVYLFRYRLGENKLFQHHKFVVSKTTTLAELPIDIQLSAYSQYLLVKQFNGNVLVFAVPDIPM